MRRARVVSLAVAVVGFAAWTVGRSVEPRQAMFSYLTAYVFVASVVLGALLLLGIGVVSNAAWFVVLRRRVEDFTTAMPVLAVLFVPIAWGGLSALYPWAAPERTWTEAVRVAVTPKRSYLNDTAFLARTLLYFAVWIVIVEVLRRASLRHDQTRDPALLARQRSVAAVSLPIVGFTLTFAAFDWVMSLDPAWSSTVFGIYLFAGGISGAVGLLAFVAFGARSTCVVEATAEHGHALGRILLTFVIFWAYIAFCQYLLIWIADIPREIQWVAVRTAEGWGAVAIALIVGHFALPFLALLPKETKRRAASLAAMGMWMLVAHYVDVYWMVIPALGRGLHVHWLDAAALAAVGGTSVSVVFLRATGEAGVAVGDPRLAESVRYEAAS